MADRIERTVFEKRVFLSPGRLDAFRAYLEETVYPDAKEGPARYIGAGFVLSEEVGGGHFCFTSDHNEDPEADLQPVVNAAEEIIAGLSKMIEAIEGYRREASMARADAHAR